MQRWARMMTRKRKSVQEEASSSVMLSPGTISRHNVKANPLKHVAHLLRQELVYANGAPCNMLQEKHDTTLWRIYDVVNVCEGAVTNLYPKLSSVVNDLFEGLARWVGGSSDYVLGENNRASEFPCKEQKLFLEVEKGHAVDRILQKRRLCDTLSEQVAVLEKLVEQNMAQCSEVA